MTENMLMSSDSNEILHVHLETTHILHETSFVVFIGCRLSDPIPRRSRIIWGSEWGIWRW